MSFVVRRRRRRRRRWLSSVRSGRMAAIFNLISYTMRADAGWRPSRSRTAAAAVACNWLVYMHIHECADSSLT